MTYRKRNPSGFVRKHPDTSTTRWQGIIKYPDPDQPGQWRQRSKTFARRSEAQKWVDDALNTHRKNPQYRSPSVEAFGSYLNRWLDEVVAGKVRDTTLIAYRRYAKPLIAILGKRRLDTLTPLDIQGVYSDMAKKGKAAVTIRHTHTIARSALADAVEWGLIPTSPADRVKPPRTVHQERVTMTLEQAQKLLEGAENDRLRALWWFLAMTGCRRGEALALKWDDIDWNRKVVVIQRTLATEGSFRTFHEPKTAKGRRTVALSDHTIEVLKLHYEGQRAERLERGSTWKDEGYVFTNRYGGLLWPNDVWRTFKRLVERTGLPKAIRMHDLRHAMATAWLANGIPVKVVSERLGHGDISVTLQIYGHVLPNMQAEAAEAMDNLLMKKYRN